MGEVKLDKIICNCPCVEQPGLPKYFTQFNIYKNFHVPCRQVEEDDIEATVATLQINSAKIIDTIEGGSLEGQNLTGKKLIIIGNVNTKTILKDAYEEEKYCVLEKNIPFSTFIIIPREICDEQPINLRYLIEDVTTTIVEEGKIFISITLLIKYVDEY